MNNLKSLLETFTAPVLTILGGLILLFSPDTATVLIATVIGWVLLIVGVLLAIDAVLGNQGLSGGIRAGACILAGVWLTRSPMSLAVAIGKLLGVGLLVGAVSGLRRSSTGAGRGIYLAEGIFGVVLLIAPLTATRTVYIVLGLIALAVGIGMLMNRLRNHDRLDSGSDGIIDV